MKTQSHTANEILAQCGIKNSSPLFQEAFQEQSNREMEWLWYAEWVANDAEKRYCLQRALHINPNSTAARKGLAVLRRKHTAEMQPTNTFSLRRFVRSWISTMLFNRLRRDANTLASE